jgi:hypothetical protein
VSLDQKGEDLQLELVEAGPGGLPDPLDALVVVLGRGGLEHLGPDVAGSQARIDPDDVGLAGGDAQHPLAAPADDDGRMRALDRRGRPERGGHLVVLTLVGGLAGGPQGLQDGQALGHAGDPHTCRVGGDAGLLVVGGHPPGSQAELDPALGDQVEGGHLLGQHHRVPVVVAEHQ